MRQLVPFVDRRYRTVGRRSGRAVAGLSMGGFGALSYASRHPDLFAAAAAFSGAVDTNNAGIQAVDSARRSLRAASHPGGALARKQPGWTWPPTCAACRLTLRTGNGQPGGPFGGGPDGIEIVVHDANMSLHQRLRALGIAHVWDDYGPGAHTWPYWQRDLRQTLPSTARRLPPQPRSARPLHLPGDRPAVPDLRLAGGGEAPGARVQHAAQPGPAGASASRGSGTARVVTARLFRPRTRVAVTARFSFGKPAPHRGARPTRRAG